MTQVYGILGYPVAHSRSPRMHNAAFAAFGLDSVYVRFEVRPERLGQAVRGLTALGVHGANITVPHKAAVIAFLEAVTDEARAIGAVNTLVRDGERWTGHNTDAAGLARSLEYAAIPLAGARIVLLGAGGAARASVVGLAQRGAARIVIAARRREQAERLVGELMPVCGSCEVCATELAPAPLRTAFVDASLVVQCTGATLSPQLAVTFAAGLPFDVLPPEASVVDLVYEPRETAVLAAARARGLRCVDGLGMLLHQGALAFTLWTGRPAPVDVMQAALEGHPVRVSA